MKKIYQTVTNKNQGNCMQAAIASLFEKELDDVPNFIEFESYFPPLHKFITKNGYEYCGMLQNKNYSTLLSPTDGCFNAVKWHRSSIITKRKLYSETGVNGYFYASVLSPKYFNWYNGRNATHAVIIDKGFNIVHDVNPEYHKIIKYPLSNILGYNGIINVHVINRKGCAESSACPNDHSPR